MPDAAPFNVLLTCYTLFERDSEEQRLDRKFLKRCVPRPVAALCQRLMSS